MQPTRPSNPLVKRTRSDTSRARGRAGAHRIMIRALLVLLTGIAAVLAAPPRSIAERTVIGASETVLVERPGIRLRARIDTGAGTSAIHATNIRVLWRAARRWVAFTLHRADGSPVPIERPLLRFIRIRRSGTPDVRRPVVRLWICLGGHRKHAEFSLTNRRRMRHPILIGRRMMRGRFLVNPDADESVPPNCPPR